MINSMIISKVNIKNEEIIVCRQISHVKGYIGANEESLIVNNLVIPANKLVPLMRPDSFSFLINVFVRLGTDIIVTSFDCKIESFERYRTSW